MWARVQAVAGPKVDMKDLRDQIKKLEDRLDALEGAPLPAANLAMAVREGSPGNSPLLNRTSICRSDGVFLISIIFCFKKIDIT